MTDATADYLLVLTCLPDRDSALKLARTLIEKRLAGCVNVLDGCTSVFRWQDAVQAEQEIPVLIKTHAERFESLQEAILSLHPYELPEVIALRIDRGLEDYLEWVGAEVDISG